MSRKIVYNQMIVKFYNYTLLIMLSVMFFSCNNNDETKSNQTNKSLINNKSNEIKAKNNLEETNLRKLEDSNKSNNINSQNLLNKNKGSAIFIEAEKDAILYANMYCKYMMAMKNNNKELATQYQNEAKKIHQQIYPKYLDSKRPETLVFKEKAEELADACMRELKK
tara:strand:+ start:222 stop:722 length:501 start_codon:yes stop_codon:yes gene_type:complete